jgi:hypothetical protein
VQAFTVRPRGGADLNVKLLQAASDAHTPAYVAAIIPLSPLKSATTYDVTFTGTATNSFTFQAVPVNRTWSFTTR